MEEAWELAAVSGVPAFMDWSGRHTRLRYQSVLTSMLFLIVLIYGVEEISIPGFFKLQRIPDLNIIAFGLLIFAIYSITSFVFQHRIEKRSLSLSSKSVKNLPRMIASKYEWDPEDHNPFKTIRDAIAPSARSNGNVKGAQAISGRDGEQYREALGEVTRLKGLIKSGDYLSEELVKQIPNRSSSAYAFTDLRRVHLAWFDQLMESLKYLEMRIYDNQPIACSFLRSLDEDLRVVEKTLPFNEADILEVESEIIAYSRDRTFHSEILPFWVPISTATISIFAGLGCWVMKLC